MSPVSQGLAPKVFISHSSSGDPVATAFVDALRSRLREWGIDPWLDRDRLQDGLPWNDQIRLEMQRCDAAVLVVTARYLRPGAHYARDEALIFAQRAAVERFDDFQLIVLLAPDVSPEELRTADEWKNLEIHRLQVRQLATLAPEAVDQLQPFVAGVLERYCSGAVPLVIREHYTDQIVKQASSAVLVQACQVLDPGLETKEATPRRYVNAVLGATAQVRTPLERVEPALRPWKAVLSEEVRASLAWDAVAFSWLDDGVAGTIAAVTRDVGGAGRKALVLVTDQRDTMRLHLRRVRDYVAPSDDTDADPQQTTREGLIRAICSQVKARRARREPRDPATIPEADLEVLARDLNARIHAANSLVVVLERDLCDPELLHGVPEIFSNVVFVALAEDADTAALLDDLGVVVRPTDEDDVLQVLDAVG